MAKKASKLCIPTLDSVSVINDNALLLEAKKNSSDYFAVDALAWSNQRVLFLKRPVYAFMGEIDELPSGNVEASENLHVASHPEVQEETSLEVTIVRYIVPFDFGSKSDGSV